MASPIFHLFEQLPQELQMSVWRYAATLEGTLNLSEDVFLLIGKKNATRTIAASSCHARFLKQTSTKQLPLVLKRDKYDPASQQDLKQQGEATSRTRTSLLGTCRLARQVVLETWGAEIQSTSVSDSDLSKHYSKCGWYQRAHAITKDVKEELLATFEKLISLVQRGQPSCIPRRFGASRRTRTALPGMYKEEEEADDEDM